VDTEVIRGKQVYKFVDTAGIRRKGKTTQLSEKLSVIMARKHLERADVALLIADASAGISAGDATIAGYAHESGRSVIIVLNKWDLALEEAKRAAEKAKKTATGSKSKMPATDSQKLAEEYEPLVRERLKFLNYAPVVFISAMTGEKVDELYKWIDRVTAARRKRISTGALNRWLREVDLGRGTSPTAHRVKIFYITQASTSPPTFILFTNQRERLHFSYERFLENRLRAEFDFLGSPIRFLQRVRDRSHSNRERALAQPKPKHKSLYKFKPKHKRGD
jgi:GTP-binding protein